VEAAALTYMFRFTGPEEEVQTRTVAPGDPRSFTVKAVPGTWAIAVSAYTAAGGLRGMGTDAVEVIPGETAQAQIQMRVVVGAATFEELQLAVNKAGAGEIILINGDFLWTAPISIPHKQITIAADGEDRGLWRGHDFTDSFFILGGVGSLTLGAGDLAGTLGGTLTLNGYKADTAAEAALVTVNNGGLFILQDGATLADNKADGATAKAGGVTVNDGGSFEMNGGTISGNETTGTGNNGGGVLVATNGAFTMSGGTISGNEISGNGGGVYVDTNGTFTMSEGIISGNEAASNGGGVYVAANGEFSMSEGTISGNKATGTSSNGGGVFVAANGEFSMAAGAVISNNEAASNGGGVYTSGTSNINGGTISDNHATGNTSDGGGVYASGAFTMGAGALISNNTSTRNGGGVYVNASTFIMNGGTISGNHAIGTSSNGGGVYINYGTLTMGAGTEISNNAAASNGGGVYIYNSTFTMNGGTISGNSAVNNGSGVYANLGNYNAFNMQGNAFIDIANKVWLAALSRITLTGDLTHPDSYVANIIYGAGTPNASTNLLASNPAGFLTSGDPQNYTRFLYDGVAGKINSTNGNYIP
jgi:hypothetical protein